MSVYDDTMNETHNHAVRETGTQSEERSESAIAIIIVVASE